MDYTQYEPEDFLSNESFVNYCSFVNDADVQFWSEWILLHPHKRKAFEQAVSLYEVLNGGWKRDELNNNFNTFSTRLNLEDISEPGVKIRKNTIKIWLSVAAAFTAITLCVWLYAPKFSDRLQEPGATLAVNEVAPGRNTATLSLANGKTVQLSDDKSGIVIGRNFKYNDGSPVGVSVNNEPQMLTAKTPRGGTYQLILPDGSKIWLNADSKITFPSQFRGKQRKVILEGEGYFEVAKNKAKPFIVESRGQHVEVLGTHFNINSYPDEKVIKTTLLEGSINVNGAILKPDQQAVLTRNNDIEINNVDPSEAVAWQKGYFLFDQEDIKSVMRKIARWYDVEIIYEGNTDNIIVGGAVSRFKNVSKILEMLQETGAVKFRRVDKKVYVKQ